MISISQAQEIRFDVKKLILTLGYFGVFLSSLISSSTVFIPLPIYIPIISISTQLGFNPILVSLLASLGSAIGEFLSYLIGSGIKQIEGKRYERLKKLENFFKKFGGISILIFAILPLPFDLVGILAGLSRYDVKRFFIYTIIGKFFKMLLIYYLSFYGIELIHIFVSS